MSDGLHIQRILAPIFAAPKVKKARREDSGSGKQSFKGHLEDGKDNPKDDGPASDNMSRQDADQDAEKASSTGGKMPSGIQNDLGNRVDIRI